MVRFWEIAEVVFEMDNGALSPIFDGQQRILSRESEARLQGLHRILVHGFPRIARSITHIPVFPYDLPLSGFSHHSRAQFGATRRLFLAHSENYDVQRG